MKKFNKDERVNEILTMVEYYKNTDKRRECLEAISKHGINLYESNEIMSNILMRKNNETIMNIMFEISRIA